MSSAVATGPVYGHTRWRRVAILLLPAFGAVAAMVLLVAKGALAVNLDVSGQPFVLSATSITATGGFTQYALPNTVASNDGSGITTEEGNIGVTAPGAPTLDLTSAGQGIKEADTVSVLKTATINGLHQTVCAPFSVIPGLPKLEVALDATTATSPALVVDAPALAASSAQFNGIQIGADLNAALGTTPATSGLPGGLFSQSADSVTLNNVKQVATNTEASSFTLNGLSLSASFVSSCP